MPPSMIACQTPANFTWLIGLSTCLSPPDLDTGRLPARARSAEPHPTDPACLGRSERLLRPPSAPGACAAERAYSKRRFPDRPDDSTQAGDEQLRVAQPRICRTRHNLPSKPCSVSHVVVIAACVVHYKRTSRHFCRGTVHHIIPSLYIVHVHRRAPSGPERGSCRGALEENDSISTIRSNLPSYLFSLHR